MGEGRVAFIIFGGGRIMEEGCFFGGGLGSFLWGVGIVGEVVFFGGGIGDLKGR